VNASPTGGIDARGDRAVQSAVGVVLLAAFVFGVPIVVPIVGVLLVAGAAIGPHANPLHLAYVRMVAPRLGPATATVDPPTIRRQDVLLAGLCAIATIGFGLGVSTLSWFVVVIAALVAIIAATTRVHLGDQLQRLTNR
jgi:hypothetical protein